MNAHLVNINATCAEKVSKTQQICATMRKFIPVINLSNAKAVMLVSLVLKKGKSMWKSAKEKLLLKMESHISASFVTKASIQLQL